MPWAAYGTDMRESEADLNRPGYLRLLAGDWLAALPGVQQRLRAAPPARVADIGCGAGWSCIGLARGYPMVRVDGYDLDPASVELARCSVAAAGLAGRVRVHHADITTAPMTRARPQKDPAMPAPPRTRGRARCGSSPVRRPFYPAVPAGQPVSAPVGRSSPSGCGCWAGSLSAAIRK